MQALSLRTPASSFTSQQPARTDRRVVKVHASSWTKALTKDELRSAGGKKVVELAGQRILLAEVDGDVYAVSNKCSHLGLPLVGKTAMFQGKVEDKCIVCPAHGTRFDLASGQVKGEWCPSLPNLPIIGKGPPKKDLPTYQVRVDDNGTVEVLV